MSRRNRRTERDLLDRNQSTDNIFDMDEKILGEIDRADASMQVAHPISIFDIHPDPAQPRRVAPSAVREETLAMPAQDMLETWIVRAFEERHGRKPADPDEAHAKYRAVVSGLPVANDAPAGIIEASLLRVAELAADILHLGRLIHPIHVAPDHNRKYRVITGERRWLAHHLLTRYDFPGFDKIPAVEGEFDVWMQASENNQRSDLNAIGRARQYAILLMDLLRQEGREFRTLYESHHEQEFYAQVANERVPHGQSERIMSAMGLTSRVTLSDYRRLLYLPPHIWTRADDENWAKNDLLQIVRSANISDGTDAPQIVQPLDNSAGYDGSEQPENVNSIDISDETEDPQIVRSSDNSAAVGGELPENVNSVDISTERAGGEQQENVRSTDISTHIPNIPSSPTPPPQADVEPVRGRWPRVGDKVITQQGHIGEVLMIISPKQVQVQTKFRRGVFDVATLRPYTPEDEPQPGNNGLLYPEGPADDPLVEHARQIAMDAVGDGHRDLEERIRTHQGHANQDYEVHLGGGNLIINSQLYTVSRGQVAVVLKHQPDGDLMFRFNAERLLDWKLSNRPLQLEVDPDSPQGEAPERAQAVGQGQPALFKQPFTVELHESGVEVFDRNRRLVGRWQPSHMVPEEANDWLNWMIELGNTYAQHDVIQGVFELAEHFGGRGPAALQEFMDNLWFVVRSELDDLGGKA